MESTFETAAFISYRRTALTKQTLTLPSGVENGFTELSRKDVNPTGQTVTCWFLSTVAIIELCCYRTAKLYLPTVELDYKLMKRNFVLLLLRVVPTSDYNVAYKGQELIGTTYHIALETGCHINRCCYKRARIYCDVQSMGFVISIIKIR